ncbi:MAG: hypothetical protein RJA09_865 [Pseudomonadota bacterium]
MVWNRWLARPSVKTVFLGLCSVPLWCLVWSATQGGLGANPAEALIRSLGDWTLRFLCLTLAITPLRRSGGWTGLAAWRRGLGLWAFVYALCHATAYTLFDMGLDMAAVVADVAQRPFILVGLLAFTLMLPLALTSFNAAIRWMGGRRWQVVHRLVYLVAVLALLHFYWMRSGKNNYTEVHIYSAVLGGLGLWRLYLKRATNTP